MIVWREKFQAFGVHFVVTLIMAAAAAAMIYWVWFPEPFDEMLGGTKLFLLISGCDLALGPLTSLVIYNSKKSRRALIFDYTVVGLVQLAAFIYGVYSLENSRPVYVAFVKDRFEVVLAAELAKEDLEAAVDPYRSLPMWGPRLVGTQRPEDKKEREAIMFAAMEGKDIQNFPRYYAPYEKSVEDIKAAALPLQKLQETHPKAQPIIDDAVASLKVPKDQLLWLPVRSPRAFWTILLDAKTGQPLIYIPVDPF